MVRRGRILAHGYNRRIVPGKSWETSAVQDALFGSIDAGLDKSTLFCTCFPTLEDMKLVIATGIYTLYFFGKPSDPETVRLVNEWGKQGLKFELVQLEVDAPE